jgi:hypothetical protein
MNAATSPCLNHNVLLARTRGAPKIKTSTASTVRKPIFEYFISLFDLTLIFFYESKPTDSACPADQNNDYCQNNGWGSTWCSPDQDAPSKCGSMYPPKQCPDKQQWCGDKQQCECPEPMQWSDSKKKCEWQPMPKPSCPILQSPFCGKSKEDWCPYGECILTAQGAGKILADNLDTDANNDKCSNDGTCYTFCAIPAMVDSLVQSIFSL